MKSEQSPSVGRVRDLADYPAVADRGASRPGSHEGFTESFAVWHVAASGLASREWFAERIAIMDAAARGSAVYGKVAFGDPDVGWRDHDGPREVLGYRGGALLAFQADVELRRQQPVAKVL